MTDRSNEFLLHSLGCLKLRDIPGNPDVVGRVSPIILDCIDAHPLWKDLAVLALVPDLTLPVTRTANRSPHPFIELPTLFTRLQKTRIFPEQFLSTVLGNIKVCRIHGLNGPVHTRYYDAFSRVFEDARREA